MRLALTPIPLGAPLRGSHAPIGATASLLFLLCLTPAPLPAQNSPETVGRIEGEDIAVKGPISVEVQNGRSVTLLNSGSDVTVRSGKAYLLLSDSGEIGICGPAHFSVLKANGAVTLAFEYGRVHARLAGSGTLIFYTPLIVATPVAIGHGGREVTVGLDASASMCVLAARGALRIEQQLTGQSLLVPEGGEVQLSGSELSTLRGVSGACQCDALSARKEAAPAPKPAELSVLAPPARPRAAAPAGKNEPPALKPEFAEKTIPPLLADLPRSPGKPGPPATEEPIYKVLMPPLTFDAAAAAPPPDPDPQAILLLRSVRVRDSVVYRGHVQPLPPQPAVAEAPPVLVAQAQPQHNDDPPRTEPRFLSRVWSALRRTFSKNQPPCAGVGCR
jgi:hypothetical protein